MQLWKSLPGLGTWLWAPSRTSCTGRPASGSHLLHPVGSDLSPQKGPPKKECPQKLRAGSVYRAATVCVLVKPSLQDAGQAPQVRPGQSGQWTKRAATADRRQEVQSRVSGSSRPSLFVHWMASRWHGSWCSPDTVEWNFDGVVETIGRACRSIQPSTAAVYCKFVCSESQPLTNSEAKP